MKIDKEFKSIIPEISESEFVQLEKNIKDAGCLDTIKTWDGFIIDGHNRYDICQRLGIEFNVEEMSFENRDEVKAWIIENQLGRRNINQYQRSVLALKHEYVYKKKAKLNLIKGGQISQQPLQNSVNPVDTQKEVAKIADVSHDTIAKVKIIEEKATDEQKEKLIKNRSSINAVYKDIVRVEKKHEIKKIPEKELSGKYNVVYADPPWEYNNNNVSLRGNAEDHYPAMSIEEIMEMKIKDITLDNAVLFLWTTTSMIKKAFSVIDAWGFEFKTSMIWVKNRIGTGFYVRGKHEILLIGIKGQFLPMTTKLPESVIFADKEKHSKKPDVFYDIIENLYPEQKYIELFARKTDERKDWTFWGNEL